MDTPDEQRSLTITPSRSSQVMRSNETSLSSESMSSSTNLSKLKSDTMRPMKKFTTDLNNLPDVPEIDAFKRGYQVETLLDMFENNFGKQYLYIKFKNLLDPELVPLELAVKKVGHLMPRFYRDYVNAWNKWEEAQKKEKIIKLNKR